MVEIERMTAAILQQRCAAHSRRSAEIDVMDDVHSKDIIDHNTHPAHRCNNDLLSNAALSIVTYSIVIVYITCVILCVVTRFTERTEISQ